MKRIFVCLANSKKYTERCVAGIELKRGTSGFSIVRDANEPHWIRPVSANEHGEVPMELVNDISLLDIVEIDALQEVPQGYQSENVIYGESGFSIVGKIHPSAKYLDKLVSQSHSILFLNRGKAVSAEHVNDLDHSLVFIKPASVEFFVSHTTTGQLQTRARFIYRDIHYDLPVTDVDFLVQFSLQPNEFVNLKNVYLTISLGLEFQGWHHKLIAGVICF
jgi:hypothetical protein